MYKDKVKLCYMDTDSFVIYIKTEYFYEDFGSDAERGLIHLTMMRMMKDRFQ